MWAWPNDECIVRVMRDGALFEQELVLRQLREHVVGASTILDVGAHIGSHTVLYAKLNPSARIVAIEPQGAMAAALEQNVLENGAANVTVRRAACGHRLCTARMSAHTADGPSTHEPVAYGAAAPALNLGGLQLGQDGEEVAMLTVDSLDLPVGYMKVDVEGAEALVVLGALRTIQRYHPVICFESNYKRVTPAMRAQLALSDREAAADAHTLLRSLGYDISALGDDNWLAVWTGRPRVHFGGCARNVARFLPRVLPALTQLADELAGIGGWRCTVYHNDSSDSTLRDLQDWAADGEGRQVVDAHDARSDRVERLATGRDAVLATAREDGADLLVLADLDDKFPFDALRPDNLSALRRWLATDEWDALSFSRKGLYYDISALRTDADPHFCWSDELRGRDVERLQTKYWQLLQQLPADQLLEVQSAFNGFAVYRVAAMRGCGYGAKNAHGGEECEHVVLHQQMRGTNAARIRVAPQEMGD